MSYMSISDDKQWEIGGSYFMREAPRVSNTEINNKLLSLARGTKKEAQKIIDCISALEEQQSNVHTDFTKTELKREVEDLLNDVPTDIFDAPKIFDAAYQSVESAVQQAQKIKLVCEEEVRNTEDLLLKQRRALAEAGELLKKAKASKQTACKYACLKKESNSARARRLNDGTMVTVVCITYNHEAFIAQALDSFLMQKTNFKFKVFVGEDCGPDHTADIVREYAARYPDIIVPFIREKNMGAQRNLIDLCQRATSPYIAFCEGDDYWIDEYKLQKQFDYMESHQEAKVCTTKTEILAPNDWHLRSWYKAMPDGKILMPDSTPGFCKQNSYSPAYLVGCNVAHTSSFFFRWDYDLELPEWYYEGYVGDMPLLLLQLGNSNLIQLDSVSSVYRINEGSAFFNKNREEHFLQTRVEYIRYLCGIRDYAIQNFKNYPIIPIENRIKLEAANYLQILVKKNMTDDISEFFSKYPQGGRISLNAYLSFYNDQRALTGCWGWDGYKLAVRNKCYRNTLRPLVKAFLKIEKWKSKRKKFFEGLKIRVNILRAKFKNLAALILYWRYTLTPKADNLWVFSGFNKRAYMDNTMYFYEYVLEHHPEIQAVWITLNEDVFKKLNREGKPVVKMRTAQCRHIVSKASIAVTDHFRMSDYDAFSGLNDRLKIVQLWHGVGLKTIGDLKNTDVPGVQFSDDILSTKTDSLLTKARKKVKYFRHAYYRELFEHYFMLVCPGPERIDQIAKPWHIPLDRCFITGHPRNILLHTTKASSNPCEVLYAPTYRWEATKEKELVIQIADFAEQIQKMMEQNNATFTVRLHPHTWRNYSSILDQLEEQYDRIHIDREKDVYQTLGKYSIVISDYSSIAYDFILLDRPVVFFNYDYEDFVTHECKLNYDYDKYSPGVKTKTWPETLDAVVMYLKRPGTDSAWRQKVRNEFYDMSMNDEHNSERIVQEIQRRLKEKR